MEDPIVAGLVQDHLVLLHGSEAGHTDPARKMPNFTQELLPLMSNIRSFARSLCHNAVWAEDLVQETLLRAWASRLSYEPQTNLKAWVFTIMRNQFYNDLRKKKRSIELSSIYAPLVIGTPETQSAHVHFQDVARGLNELAPNQREALLFVCVEGLSCESVAGKHNCAVGTIKSRVSRARRALEDKFGGPDAGAVPASFARRAFEGSGTHV